MLRAFSAALCGSLYLAIGLVGATAPAQAAITHQYSSSFPINFPVQIAIDESTDQVFVFQAFSPNEYNEAGIRRFDAEGNESIFSAIGTNQVDGCCLGTDESDQAPSNGIGSFPSRVPEFGVDSSPGATQHYIAVPFDGGGMIFFDQTGTWVTTVSNRPAGGCGLAIDPTGAFYVGHEGLSEETRLELRSATVDKFAPGPHTSAQKFASNSHLHPRQEGVCNVAADSTGGTYVNRTSLIGLFTEKEMPLEYYASNLFDIVLEDKFEGYIGVLGRRVADATGTIAVDTMTDDVYATQNDEVAVYDPLGNPVESFGKGEFEHASGIAVNGSTGWVYVSNLFASEVRIYKPVITPDITEVAAAPGQTSATVSAHVAPDGPPTVTACEVEYGLDAEYGSAAPCPGTPFGGGTDISVGLPGLETETTYHYRVDAANSNGVHHGVDNTFTTHAVADVTTDQPSGITLTTATLSGSFNGNGESTTTFFEWGKTTAYGSSTPEAASSPTGAASTSAPLTELLSYTANSGTYHYRLIAKNSKGTTYGDDVEFHTLAPDLPTISGAAAQSLTRTEATLTAQVNPQGGPTGVRFEIGPTAAYGRVIEIADPLAPDTNSHGISSSISGLTPGTTYHFRAVATNFAGTTMGEDAVFNAPADPQVTDAAASAVSSTEATVRAMVRPGFQATSFHFEYGPTVGYGSSVGHGGLSGADNDEHEVFGSISGLSPNTTYHFRVVASNASGAVTGTNQIFTTSPRPAGGGAKPACKKHQVRRHGKCVPKKRHKRHGHRRKGGSHG